MLTQKNMLVVVRLVFMALMCAAIIDGATANVLGARAESAVVALCLIGAIACSFKLSRQDAGSKAGKGRAEY